MFFLYGFGTKRYVTVTGRIFPPEFLKYRENATSSYGIRNNSSVLYQIEKSGNEYDLKENYRIPYVEKVKHI